MLYELRVYDVMPGKLPALNDRFAKITLRYFEKHGIKVVGFWTDVIGRTNQLTYMLAFDDMAHREKVWSAFQADPDRLHEFEETERNGMLVARVTNTLMRPTAYSPMQ
jgi:hypothetical protein